MASALPSPKIQPAASLDPSIRVQARGKFLHRGSTRLLVRGVTYGTFRPYADGSGYPPPAMLRADFSMMRAHGINAVRTYTPPPRWLLDEAQSHGLVVLVGLPWEQHILFLDSRRRKQDIRRNVARNIQGLANHAALLGFTVGNEIPASIVRWYGRARIEAFLHELYNEAKQHDPESLITYCNFPTTEYLELPFFDLACFNVYLESPSSLSAYLAKLHVLAGNKPLLLGEVGLDSRRNGLLAQAEALDWQLERSFAAGCAGTFVFAWTDEWHRGGAGVEDWDFGLVTREKAAKPALAAVQSAYEDPLRTATRPWPSISVVVCTYNGSRTLAETLEGVANLDYPRFELIVVDDGSTDSSGRIAESYGARVIRVPNGGLSQARNLGARAANGEIVAFLDDDAYPDQHWLHFLAIEFMEHPGHAAAGGPNIPPRGDGWIAQAVANAPGGPVEVMITDREAEHIPGCNLAVRRDRLLAVQGFDGRFRVAGDDVDFCWRLLEQGWTIGFHPAAAVWHHRRNSIRAFWKQQRGYGKAEALLERKHPARYNAIGHVSWRGRVYGKGIWKSMGWRRQRIYHGTWNAAPYQSLYHPRTGLLDELILAPEWYVVVCGLSLLSLLGLDWVPLRTFWPLTGIAALIPFLHVLASVRNARFPESHDWPQRIALWSLTVFLFVTQPLARLFGRISLGLTPLRKPGSMRWTFPASRHLNVWSTQWKPADRWLALVEQTALGNVSRTVRGGGYDPWDLEFRMGLLGSARLTMAIEEHGGGNQMLRFRVVPRWFAGRWFAVVLTGLAAGAAFASDALQSGMVLLAMAGAAFLEGTREAGGVLAAALAALRSLPGVTVARS